MPPSPQFREGDRVRLTASARQKYAPAPSSCGTVARVGVRIVHVRFDEDRGVTYVWTRDSLELAPTHEPNATASADAISEIHG